MPEPGDGDEEISMTFTREEWGRIYVAVKERVADWDKKRETETWIAHEKIRIRIAEQL